MDRLSGIQKDFHLIVGIVALDFLKVLIDRLVVVVDKRCVELVCFPLNLQELVVMNSREFPSPFFKETQLIIRIPESVPDPFSEDDVFAGDEVAVWCLVPSAWCLVRNDSVDFYLQFLGNPFV